MPVPHTPTGQHRSRGRSGQGASASASPASGTASCHASPRQPLLTTRSKTPTPTKGPSIPADQYCITTAETPKRMLELIEIAKTRWLAKTEIHEILTNTTQFALRVSEAQIHLPPSGTLVLYDRATMRRFRKDGTCIHVSQCSCEVSEIYFRSARLHIWTNLLRGFRS